MIELCSAPSDLAAYVAVWNALAPDEPTSVAEQRRRLEQDARRLHLVVADDGVLVGCGFAGPSDSPERAVVQPRVRPDRRGRGIGTLVLDELLAHVTRLGFETASSWVDGNDARSLAFARRHGFEEVDRQVEQVRALGEEADAEAPDRLALVTIEERPERLREAFDLALEGFADMATATPVTISLADWLADEATVPAGSFLALSGGEIVAYSGLCRRPDGTVEDGLTVVRRAWRRRGVASALKRVKLAWAAAHGIPEVVTWTQSGNEGMRALNERLGYVYRSVSVLVRTPLPRAG
jgi:GNAT superfamily N-acetyltransferase